METPKLKRANWAVGKAHKCDQNCQKAKLFQPANQMQSNMKRLQMSLACRCVRISLFKGVFRPHFTPHCWRQQRCTFASLSSPPPTPLSACVMCVSDRFGTCRSRDCVSRDRSHVLYSIPTQLYRPTRNYGTRSFSRSEIPCLVATDGL